MKQVVIAFATLLLFLTPTILTGQQAAILDSIHFQLEDHKSMEIISHDFYAFDKWGSINDLYKHFIADLNQISGEVNVDQSSNNFQ